MTILLVSLISFEKFVPRFLQNFGFQLFISHSSYSQEIINEGRSIYNQSKYFIKIGKRLSPQNISHDSEALIISDGDLRVKFAIN